VKGKSNMSVKSCAGDYGYGFQGQEKDDEWKGSGNSLNYKYRVHDPRLGRFLSIDPLAAEYAHNSPYAFSENRVIDAIELEGAESLKINYKSTVMQDLMRVYATNEGRTLIKAINDKSNRDNIMKGVITIHTSFYASSSGYLPSKNTVTYGTGFSFIRGVTQGASFPSYVILGHELQHAFDEFYQKNGVIWNVDDYSVANKKSAEISAVKFGNYLRSVYGSDWLREKYSYVFSDLNTSSTNSANETITNFKYLEGWTYHTSDLGDTFLDSMVKDKYYSASYNKSIDGGESKTFWTVSWIDDDGFANFKNFDNENDYNNFIAQ
jgi:RHS repeat-associated protein